MGAEEPETTTATLESATLFSWQWLNLSVQSLELTLTNNCAAGQHLVSSHQTIFTCLLPGHTQLNLICWHTQNNYLPVTKVCSAFLEP